MKKIAIHELKQNLSAAVSDAESGQTLLITRHRRVVARLVPPQPGLQVGKESGDAKLGPAIGRNTKGRYLEVIADDRRGGAEDV